MWHKHNVIISPSVGSSHLDKYSCENAHKYLSGWGTSRVKVISFKTKHYFINFFSNGNCRTCICCDLFRTNLESYFPAVSTSSEQLLLDRNYFDKTATCSEQLFLRNSHILWPVTFLEQSLLHRNYLVRIATFSDQKLYRASTLWKS